MRARPLVELARTFGARGLIRRAAHEALRHSGAYRLATPRQAAPSGLEPLPVDLAAVRRVWAASPDAPARAIADADAMLAGRYPFFAKTVLEIGWPPPWHRHPRTGVTWDAGAHWTEAVDGSADRGDIKWIWEPSRMAFAWLLPRAYVASGERRYASAFWQALEDWMAANPPYRGAAWSCGQETALRAFAVLFAASVLGADPEQGRLVDQVLHASGRRIALSLGHSLSQRNNHALSEAVGLWTLGVVGPAWREAARWRAAGERALREAVRDQFAPDGAYIQESINYHRLAVHVLLWARWISRARGVALPGEVADALRRSRELLAGLVPPAGGDLPNYGHNDGANLLALASCPYEDLRPTLQHLALDTTRAPDFPAGPWDEPSAWLGLAQPTVAAAIAPQPGLRITSSGYVTSRRGAWLLFTRVPCHRTHRPGHADALHVDVWRADRNIALDPGSFAYSEPAPWDNRLAETRVHNTCSVGAKGQMRRHGRFLWTHWTCAELVDQAETRGGTFVLARTAATWDRSHEHWRLIAHRDEAIDVFDAVLGTAPAPLRLHWNLDGAAWRRDGGRWSDGALTVTVAAPDGAAVRDVRGDEHSELGWSSRSYGHRVPCTAIEVTVEAASTWFHTTFGGPSAAPGALAAWRDGDHRGAFRMLADASR